MKSQKPTLRLDLTNVVAFRQAGQARNKPPPPQARQAGNIPIAINLQTFEIMEIYDFRNSIHHGRDVKTSLL